MSNKRATKLGVTECCEPCIPSLTNCHRSITFEMMNQPDNQQGAALFARVETVHVLQEPVRRLRFAAFL